MNKSDMGDLPPDSSLRDFVAISTAGALLEPEAVIADWGDHNSDYPPELAKSDDVRCSTPEELEAYYDSCNGSDNVIRIL